MEFKTPFSCRCTELLGLRSLLFPNLTPIRDSKDIRYDFYQQNQDLKIDLTFIESI